MSKGNGGLPTPMSKSSTDVGNMIEKKSSILVLGLFFILLL